MWGFQAAGAAPIVLGRPVASPETVATAIRIGSPASWDGAVAARDESDGLIESVTDDEILAAYRTTAEREGIFAEPASAAAVAGVLKYRDRLPEGPVVCTLTGHGLKDPDTALRDVPHPEAIAPTMDALAARLGW
jgi:threonine synthase